MRLQSNLNCVVTMKDETFDFDMDDLLSEFEEIERAIEKELKALYPDDESSLEYETYDYVDYFNLVENEISENRQGIYDWLEEWFKTFFGENLNGNDAYVVYSEEEQWEVCFPLKDTSMEGFYHSPSRFETDTYHIEFISDGQYFVGACSKGLLRDLIAVFKIWVETKESRITSFDQYRGYSARLLQCIKKIVIDRRVHTRQDAITMATIYLEAIQMTSDYHMNLLWQLLLQSFETMSDVTFQKIKHEVIEESNHDQK